MNIARTLFLLCILFLTYSINAQTLNVNCTSVDNTCGSTSIPNANGFAVASVSPGNPPYTYHWSTGNTHVSSLGNDTAFALPFGLYSVTVTDASMATGSCSASVSDFTPTLDYGIVIVSLPCPGVSDGTLIIATLGNCLPPPFSFALENTTTGQTWGPHLKGCGPFQECGARDTFQNLPAGNYVSVVTNALGCTGSLSVTIPEIAPPFYNADVTSVPACGSGYGKIITHIDFPTSITYNNSSFGGPHSVSITNYPFVSLYTSGGTFVSSHTNYWDTIFPNVSPGSYEVRMQISGPSCSTDVYPVTVGTSTLPSAVITHGGPLTFCSGGSVLLSAPSGSNKTYQWKKGSADISGATLSSYIATTGGNYKVTVTNTVTGCSKTTASGTAVTINPVPVATITPQGPTTFCAGGSVLLKGNSGTGLTYQWKKGGNNIAGATNKNYTATLAGVYKIKVANSYGCSKLSTGVTVTVPCRDEIGESMNSSEISVSVFPNPFHERTVLKIIPQNIFNNCSLEIYNVTGKKVREIKFVNRNEIAIERNSLEAGIYIFRLFNEKELKATGKLVVQ